MSKRKKGKRTRRKSGGGPLTGLTATMVQPKAASESVTQERSVVETRAERASRRLVEWRIVREFIVAVVALASLVVALKSCHASRESLRISEEQAEFNRRVHQEHVKPDVRVVVRHSNLPQYKDDAMAPELVVWNNGPIKAVSLNASYRLYIFDTNTLHVVASMGISEDLLDYSIVRRELAVGEEIGKVILGSGSLTVFVVNLTYYRETDMEKFSSEDYFSYEEGRFYDREGFMNRTNYHLIMANLLTKMKMEPRAGSMRNNFLGPAAPGRSHVNFNVRNLPEPSSPEWGPIVSNLTESIRLNPQNAFTYGVRGGAFDRMNNLEGAVSDYEDAIGLGATNCECYNNLAWIRSTATNASIRSGREAISLAKKACDLTGWREWAYVATLAAAYAEAGDFALAIKYQKQAMAMDGLMPLEREDEERRLSAFLQHQPSRHGM